MENNYYPDIFYSINKLSKPRIIGLLNECHKLSYNSWVDVLDGTSTARRRIDMKFEEVLTKITDRTLFVFIHRRGFSNWNWYLETGFTTMTSPIDYFLWINVEQDKINTLVEKYRLELM